MTFKVEDGSAFADSNSYGSVVAFKAYHDERGNSYAAVLPDPAKIQQCLVKATDYIDQAFDFLGDPVDDDQALKWPRENVYTPFGVLVADDSVPLKVQYACFEYALRVFTTPLWNTPLVNTTGVVTSSRKKVGPIEVETAFSQSASIGIEFPAGDKYLEDFIIGGGDQATSFR